MKSRLPGFTEDNVRFRSEKAVVSHHHCEQKTYREEHLTLIIKMDLTYCFLCDTISNCTGEGYTRIILATSEA